MLPLLHVLYSVYSIHTRITCYKAPDAIKKVELKCIKGNKAFPFNTTFKCGYKTITHSHGKHHQRTILMCLIRK